MGFIDWRVIAAVVMLLALGLGASYFWAPDDRQPRDINASSDTIRTAELATTGAAENRINASVYGVFIVPVETVGNVRHLANIDFIRTLPGWSQTWAAIPDGSIPYTMVIVAANDVSRLNTRPGVIPLGNGSSVREWLDSDTTVRALSPQLTSVLAEMGIIAIAESRQTLFNKLVARLEPTLNPDKIGEKQPETKNSITDSFDGTGAINASWTEVSVYSGSSPTLERFGNRLRVPANFRGGMWRRAESAFPDVQYSQIKTTFRNSGEIIFPQTRTGSSGQGYTTVGGSWTTTYIEMYRTTGSGFTYVTDFSGSWTANTNYTMKILSNGSSHQVYTNGVASGGSWTDSTYVSGKPGIHVYGDDTFTLTSGDDFEGTDANGTGGAPPGKDCRLPANNSNVALPCSCYVTIASPFSGLTLTTNETGTPLIMAGSAIYTFSAVAPRHCDIVFTGNFRLNP